MAENERAVEIHIFVHTDVPMREEKLQQVFTAIKHCNCLKTRVFRARRKHSRRGIYRRCVVVKIPRRRYEKAKHDGRLSKFLQHRIFRKDNFLYAYPQEILDFKESLRVPERRYRQKKVA